MIQGFAVSRFCRIERSFFFSLSGTFYIVRKRKIEIQKIKKKFSSFQRKKLLLQKERDFSFFSKAEKLKNKNEKQQ
jgi:hypothetical protein